MIFEIKTKEIGLFSDLHLGIAQDSPLWHEIALNFGKWAAQEYENKGIKDIVIAGDIFHNRSELSLKTLHVAKEFFDMFRQFNIYISVGNHDCWQKDTSEIHSIELLSEWKNIFVIDKNPRILNVGNKNISLIPWGTEVSDIPKSDICIGHFDIVSFYQNNYHVCEKGFKSEDLFKNSHTIISGHFHKKQIREYSKGKIVYLGSPFQHNFGDVGDERGIYTFKPETEELNFIKNEISPVHVKIKLSEILEKKEDSKSLKEKIPNNILRLVIDEKIDYTKLSILVSKIKILNPLVFSSEYKILDEKNEVETKDIEVADISKILDEYINKMDVDAKETLKKYIKKIYEECKI